MEVWCLDNSFEFVSTKPLPKSESPEEQMEEEEEEIGTHRLGG